MLDELALPLLLAERMEEVRGKTRFQKLLYIFQKRCEERNMGVQIFQYQPYLYGPFSMELARTIDNLVHERLLVESSDMTESGNTVVTYSLAPEGKEFLEKVRKDIQIDNRRLDILNEVVNDCSGLQLTDLVTFAKSL